MGGDSSGEFCLWRIQGKVKFRLKFFNLRLILYFFCLLTLFIHELGLGDEETETQARLKNLWRDELNGWTDGVFVHEELNTSQASLMRLLVRDGQIQDNTKCIIGA